MGTLAMSPNIRYVLQSTLITSHMLDIYMYDFNVDNINLVGFIQAGDPRKS